jgi:hypothetical protein
MFALRFLLLVISSVSFAAASTSSSSSREIARPFTGAQTLAYYENQALSQPLERQREWAAALLTTIVSGKLVLVDGMLPSPKMAGTAKIVIVTEQKVQDFGCIYEPQSPRDYASPDVEALYKRLFVFAAYTGAVVDPIFEAAKNAYRHYEFWRHLTKEC